ncbi:MAG: aspartate aminotransferase family protein [Spirochaetes bacterium]|nr:aspartate aminotransferase family protein [Spirochaetota bacterium]
MNFEEIVFLDKEYILPFYSRFNIGFRRGKGCYLYGYDGKKYLDFTSAIGVMNFGHSNKFILKALRKQSSKLMTTSNLFHSEERVKLAKLLVDISFDGGVFFSNSGAEANEAAIKIARFFGKTIHKDKYIILSLKGSFHGRTLATITATGQAKYQKNLEPLPSGFEYVEYNDCDDLESKFNDRVCAIFLEAIQGEGGVRPLSYEFVRKVEQLAKKYNALIVFDEVQTGIGRTGKYFGYQHYDIQPSIITLSKALGGGLPIGATILGREYFNVCEVGMHASTMGGNQLSTAVALATLKLLTDTNILSRVEYHSSILFSELKELQKSFTFIREVRGKGLMIGVDIDESVKVMDIINKLIEECILTLRSGENTLRLLPPLVITEKEINLFIKAFKKVLSKIKTN